MKFIEWFKLNRRIIQTYNSCDMSTFSKLVHEIMDKGEGPAKKIFTSKKYIWNIIRPKDYYKCMSDVVVKCIETVSQDSHIMPKEYWMDRAEFIITMVLTSTEDLAIRKSFIWNIMKRVPLLTRATISYASAEKITSLLRSGKLIIADDAVSPFIGEIKCLHDQIKELQDALDAYKMIANE